MLHRFGMFLELIIPNKSNGYLCFIVDRFLAANVIAFLQNTSSR